MQVAKDIPSVSDNLNLVSCEPNLIKTWMELVLLYITVILIGPLSFFYLIHISSYFNLYLLK